jgi:hypothetical protein
LSACVGEPIIDLVLVGDGVSTRLLDTVLAKFLRRCINSFFHCGTFLSSKNVLEASLAADVFGEEELVPELAIF